MRRGRGTKALLHIGKGLETILQVNLALHELKEKILEGILLIHRLIWMVAGIWGASGTCRSEMVSRTKQVWYSEHGR